MTLVSFHQPKFPSSITAVLPLIEPWSGALVQRRPADLVRAAERAEEILGVLEGATVAGPLAKLPTDVLDPSLVGDIRTYLRAAKGIVGYQSEMRDVLRARLVPKELGVRSRTLLRRMAGVVRHTLGHVDEAAALLRGVNRHNNGFAASARGLRTLAAIYAAYAQDVVRDGQNYRAADNAEAIAVADELERVLHGLVANELDRIADRVWTRLVDAYARILAAVRLVCDEVTRARFPARLNLASTPRRISRKPDSDVTSPGGSAVPPATSPAPTVHLIGAPTAVTTPTSVVA